MKIQKSFKNNKNILYIIPTPIGNLEDITIRTLNILKNELDFLLCEDTRKTQKILNKYEIKLKTKSYHEFTNLETEERYMVDILSGKKYGLVSDAGMPGISDPGYNIIKRAIKNDINVVVLPGATAFLVGIIRSNFPNNKFKYSGFLSSKSNDKKQEITSMFKDEIANVIYESPHKLLKTLRVMNEINPYQEIMVGREITKINEEYVSGEVNEVLDFYEENTLKGECLIVIKPKKEECENLTIQEYYDDFIQQGIDKKEVIKKIAKLKKVSKNEIYKMFLGEENE